MDMRYQYMPISVSLKDRRCLVVGGGLVALRKVESLLEYDTAITVVAPEIHDKLEYHAQRGRLTLEKREYHEGEAAVYGLVVCATDDAGLNKRVYEDAGEGGALVNVVDDPPHCNFVFPAVLRRDCLTAAISTDGKAPFISGHLRLVLDNIFPRHWERLMKVAVSFRNRVRDHWPDDSAKKNACYTEFLEADWKTMFEDMSEEQVEEELTRMVKLEGR
jgi:siroheme synthase-like protein